MSNTWLLEENAFDLQTAKAWEGLLTLGSGRLHIRGSFEEHLADCPQNREYMRYPGNVTSQEFPVTPSTWGTYVPGIYGEHPLCSNELLNLPFFLDLRPVVDGEKLDMAHSATAKYRRVLDLKEAVLRRELVWKTRAGCRLTLCFERFVSAARPDLCCQRLRVKANRKTELRIYAGIDADVRTNGYDHFVEREIKQVGADEIRCRVRTDADDEVRLQSQLRASFVRSGFQHGDRDGRLAGTIELRRGKWETIEKRTAVWTTRNPDMPSPEKQLITVNGCTWDELRAEHAAVWGDRWQRTDVLIDGDPSSQLAMRVSIYHLLRAHVPDSRVAIDAKGYAGEAYWGRFFWDTEMNLLPFYLYTIPDKARSLVDFRINTLPGARRVAAAYGYRGARYPWESDCDGNDCCPGWQYREHEVHVTAAVAYGLAHYGRAVDPEYLPGPAANVILQTARYWLDRLDRRPGDEHPSLLGVMGPDEYCPIAHNNAYTNRMVALALRLAAAGPKGGARERRAFREAAEELPIFRRADGLVLQCEDFDLRAPPDFKRDWPDRQRTFAAQVSQERLYRTNALKQADVILLMMLFPDEFDDHEVRQAWNYYVPRTTHDSSLSAGVHAIVALRLGKEKEAWRFWAKSCGKDLDVANGGAAEGVHIAGCGNNWQVAVFGFAGMKTAMQTDVLTLAPRLPAKWKKLSFPIVWQGVPVTVSITPATCTLRNDGRRGISVRVWGRERTLRRREVLRFRKPGRS